jgi:hypothetical protein
MIDLRKIRPGFRCRARFKRFDGSYYDRVGTVFKVWGKIPYAVTFIDSDGPIRVKIADLRLLRAKKP